MSFYTEVLQSDARFHSSQRCADLGLLEPNVRRKVIAILSDAKSEGLDLMVYETYRSTERQVALFHQGVTKLKNVGVHHYGLASDLVRVVNGQPNWDVDYSFLLRLARNHQLISGADWGQPDKHHSFVDMDHVQWCSLVDQSRLFAGTWYPSADYNPYA